MSSAIGCYGLRAALEFVLEVGVEHIAPAVEALGDRIAAGVAAKGYQFCARRTPANGAGIVSFRKPGADSAEIVHRLKALKHR